MPLRQIEIFLPAEKLETLLDELKSDAEDLLHWSAVIENDIATVRIIQDTEDLENITDNIEERFRNWEELRILITAVEAVIPRLVKEEEEKDDNGNDEGDKEAEKEQQRRIHREEIYSDLYDSAKPTLNYLLLSVLSAVVAAIGLQQNNEVVIIGAMVIAPMLGPFIALALSTTLSDGPLFRHASLSGLVGIACISVVAVVMGLLLNIDPETPALASRATVGILDLVVALAAGAAGTLSYTMGSSTAVVGVMVSVALAPSLVAAGMFLGAGHMHEAIGAGSLFAANVISLNLCAVLTFLYKGVRPNTWWEEKSARKATWQAVSVWVLLLTLLALLVWYAEVFE